MAIVNSGFDINILGGGGGGLLAVVFCVSVFLSFICSILCLSHRTVMQSIKIGENAQKKWLISRNVSKKRNKSNFQIP